MNQDPFSRFHEAFARARRQEAFDPSAAALATADADGTPSVRFVLVKQVDSRGFVFFTNLDSPKSHDIGANPRAALAFHWSSIGAQIRVTGAVQPVEDSVADAYFQSRPRASQLGAWASHQSRPVENRAALDEAWRACEQRFGDREIPRPSFWGGFRIEPQRIEFWYNREGRLHDRIAYTRVADAWRVQTLQP